MTEKLQNLIKEKIVKLPKESQEVINTFDWVNIAEQIGKKYLLNENEIGFLQIEVLFVLVGIEDADSFMVNIENEVGTTKNEAEKIADEVFEKIFEPIANIVEENIKKNLGNKKPKFEQDVDFIISGGDYSAFMESNSDVSQSDPVAANEREGVNKISGYTTETPPKMMDMKNKFLYDNDKNI